MSGVAGGRQVGCSGREQHLEQQEGNGRAAVGSTGYIWSRNGTVARGSAQGTGLKSNLRCIARCFDVTSNDVAEHVLL